MFKEKLTGRNEDPPWAKLQSMKSSARKPNKANALGAKGAMIYLR